MAIIGIYPAGAGILGQHLAPTSRRTHLKIFVMIGSVAGLLCTASTGGAQDGPVNQAAFPIPCAFISGPGELEVDDACVAAAGETPMLSPRVLARLKYTRGLASFALRPGDWYYRRRDGVTQRMVTFDNGPDDFAEGLARAIVADRIAYIDRRLRIRIRTRYDWGDRFAGGRAAVCIGCRSTPVGNGEHRVMTGGRWGIIDKAGREVVPVLLTQAEFIARRDRSR